MNTIWLNAVRASAVAKAYSQILIDDYGASEVWPLVDIASGTTIPAYVNSARNGTLTGWALQNAAGPVTGTLAPLSDGTSDYGNVFTASYQSIFDPLKGSIFIWGESSTWAGVAYAFRTLADASNYIFLAQSNTTLLIRYRAGGTIKTVSAQSGEPTGWFSTGISWDTTADEVKGFQDGSQISTTQTGLGTWAGTVAEAWIGAFDSVPNNVWSGYLAYTAVRFGSVWTPTNFANMHAAAATAGPD